MFGQPPVLEANTIWWALIIGLLVQGVMIYSCIRLALSHHRKMVQAEDKAAARAARTLTP